MLHKQFLEVFFAFEVAVNSFESLLETGGVELVELFEELVRLHYVDILAEFYCLVCDTFARDVGHFPLETFL